MKTPEDIKCGMECIRTNAERTCVKPEKGQCPRCKQIVQDHINLIHNLESRLAQAERERDAAVNDIEPKCDYCAFMNNPYGEAPCPTEEELETDAYCYGFKWRGVCSANTKEDAK